jgi:hypothetical protein
VELQLEIPEAIQTSPPKENLQSIFNPKRLTERKPKFAPSA